MAVAPVGDGGGSMEVVSEEGMLDVAVGDGELFADLNNGDVDVGPVSSVAGKRNLVEGIKRNLLLYYNLDVEDGLIEEIVVDALLSAEDDAYTSDVAAEWGGEFSIPPEAVAEGERLLAEAGGDLEALVKKIHVDTSPDRMSHVRVDLWTSDDNPERGLLHELVGGIRVETPPDFIPNGAFPQPPLRALYLKVHSAVDRMVYDTHKKGWCFFLTMASALLLTGIHFVAAHWAVNKGKLEGRTITDASGGRLGSILNGSITRDLSKEHYRPIQHPTIVFMILLLLAFKEQHPDVPWDNIDLWKADVSSAFNRLYWEPSAVRYFAMQLVGGICVLFLVGTFGYTGTPFAFEVCTRAFRWEFKRRLKSCNDMYCDDVMAGGLREDLPGDKVIVKAHMDGLLGPGSFSEKKYECMTESLRRIDWLGYTVCLRHLTLTISRRNFRKTILGFLTVDLSQRVSVRDMERLASWASRYSLICVALRPFSYRLYASFKWMTNRDASVELSADVKAIIWLWRASLCALSLDESNYARKIYSFQPKEPKVLARFDSSLKGVGFLLGWLTSRGPEWFGGGAFSLLPFGFGKESRYQNCAEFIGVNCVSLALIKMGLSDVGVLLEGDSMSALAWALSEHYSGSLVFNASLVHTAISSVHKPSYVSKNHIKGVDNSQCDDLSRGKSLEDIGLGYVFEIDFVQGSPQFDLLQLCNPGLVLDDDFSGEETFAHLWNRVYTLTNAVPRVVLPVISPP